MCHTVVPERYDDASEIYYQASSPGETSALLTFYEICHSVADVGSPDRHLRFDPVHFGSAVRHKFILPIWFLLITV